MKNLSVVIPAYNESKIIECTLRKVIAYLNGKIDFDILIINDGNSDFNLKNIHSSHQIKVHSNKKNYGKGYSIKKGVIEARGDLILIMDADLPVSLIELSRFLDEIEENDIVIGSKWANRDDLENKFYPTRFRKLLSQLFNGISRLLLVSNISDTQLGFKLFKAPIAKELYKQSKINRFASDVEILFLAQKNNYKVKELGVDWSYNNRKKYSRLVEGFKMIIDLLRIKYYASRNYYQA